MTPGAILHDSEFVFSDGSRGEKYIILLNDGQCGWYVAVKTTSQDRMYTYREGCQLDGRLPCFYLRLGRSWFPRDTWVQLDEFFEFDRAALLQGSMSGRFSTRDDLPIELRTELVQCALDSPDISGRHAREISRFID